jgi:hypothetical protein
MIDHPGMTSARITRIAREIADSIVYVARHSGSDPIAWVTGNSYMPALRSFDAAEDVWQHPANDNGEAFEFLHEELERMLSDADVALTAPEYDNALYATDLSRFEYWENPLGENLEDDWHPIGYQP